MSSTSLLHSIAAAPLLAWLPGWLVRRAFDTEDVNRLDRAEGLFLEIFLSLMVTAGLAIFLAELGILSLNSLLAGLILVCLILWRMVEIGDWRLEIGKERSNLQSLISNLQSLISLGCRPSRHPHPRRHPVLPPRRILPGDG